MLDANKFDKYSTAMYTDKKLSSVILYVGYNELVTLNEATSFNVNN